MILVKLQYEGRATDPWKIPDVEAWFAAVPRFGEFISFMVKVSPENTVAVSGTVTQVLWYQEGLSAPCFKPTVVFK